MNKFYALSKIDQFLYSQGLENMQFRKCDCDTSSAAIRTALLLQERKSGQEILLLVGANKDGTLTSQWIGESRKVLHRQNCQELDAVAEKSIEKLVSELLKDLHRDYILVGKK